MGLPQTARPSRHLPGGDVPRGGTDFCTVVARPPNWSTTNQENPWIISTSRPFNSPSDGSPRPRNGQLLVSAGVCNRLMHPVVGFS